MERWLTKIEGFDDGGELLLSYTRNLIFKVTFGQA
jgi:hypothetical protein